MIILKNIQTLFPGGSGATEMHDVHVVIKGNEIIKITKELSSITEKNAEEIDCSSMLVMPGLINMHHHFYQTLTRNLPGAQQAKLFNWLIYLYPIWGKLTAEALESATTIASAELLLSGCTTSVDHNYLFPNNHNEFFEVEMEAAKKAGIRLALCRGSMSLSKKDGGLPPDHVTQSVDDILVHSEEMINKFHSGSDKSMFQVILAPCSPFSVTEDLMIKSKKLANDKGVLCHTHLAETRDENEFCQEMYGCRPLDYLEQVGWLDKNTFLAHMVWLNKDEIERVAASGTGIAHCPTSNMRLGSGIAPIFQLHNAGAKIGIAVDGSASNDSSNMFDEVRNTLLLQRVQNGASALSARDVLNMATSGGAKILNRPELGKIEVGNAADIIGIDINRLEFSGAQSDLVAASIFCHLGHIDFNMVNGKILVRDRKLLNLDLPVLIEKHNRLAKSLLS